MSRYPADDDTQAMNISRRSVESNPSPSRFAAPSGRIPRGARTRGRGGRKPAHPSKVRRRSASGRKEREEDEDEDEDEEEEEEEEEEEDDCPEADDPREGCAGRGG